MPDWRAVVLARPSGTQTNTAVLPGIPDQPSVSSRYRVPLYQEMRLSQTLLALSRCHVHTSLPRRGDTRGLHGSLGQRHVAATWKTRQLDAPVLPCFSF